MSHKTVYVGIPAERLNGEFEAGGIAALVDEIMAGYVEGKAEEGNVKCDGYVIGGSWDGSFMTVKGTDTVLKAKSEPIPYDFDKTYQYIVNNGKRGPYNVEGIEYVTCNGGLKKSIAWNAVDKLQKYMTYTMMKLFLKGDPRVSSLSNMLETRNGDLYGKAQGQDEPVLRKSESFEEFYNKRKQGSQEFKIMELPPDAFIDLNGVWHDDNELWNEYETKLINGSLNISDFPGDPSEAAKQEYYKRFMTFLNDELRDDDCFVVVDCHCFP